MQGARVCEGEEVCQLAEGRPGLGHLQEPILGHTHPTVDQRRWRGGKGIGKGKYVDQRRWGGGKGIGKGKYDVFEGKKIIVGLDCVS